MKISYKFFDNKDLKSLIDLWAAVFKKREKTSLSLIKWLITNKAGDLYLARDVEKNIIVGSRAGWI